MTITAQIPTQIQRFLDDHSFPDHPTIYEFPGVLHQNLDLIEDLPVQVYLAHKATKSQALINAAYQSGIGIDVSSLGEHNNALDAGVPAEAIEATGPKNTEFIKTLVNENVLISVDSLAELHAIASQNTAVNVQLRVANPLDELNSTTKFGIRRDQLSEAKTIVEQSNLVVQGLHYHGDGLTSRLRANIVSAFLDIIEDRFPSVSLINVGGGFKAQRLQRATDWAEHIQRVIEDLKDGETTTWSQTPYGLRVTRDNTIQGRESAMLPAQETTLRQQLTDFLSENVKPMTTVADVVQDTDIDIAIEPGHALLHNTAIATFPVEHVKQTPTGSLTVVDGHTFMVSKHMSPPRATPLLKPDGDGDDFNTYIGGLLCRNDDVFTTRKVTFRRRPASGDTIVFFNQGAYASYEQGRPQLHSRANTEVISES